MVKAGPVSSVVVGIGGFSLSIAVATLVSLVAVPVLVVTLGPVEWGILVLVQTIAQFAGVFVAFGWGATGAAMVAGSAVEERQALYLQSLRVRVLLYVGVAPVTAAILYTLTRGDLTIAILGAVVYLLPYLGGAWFFTGEARPIRMLVCDTVPTACGAMLGLVGAALTHELWIYLALQGLGILIAIIVDALVILRNAPPAVFPRVVETIHDQRHAVLTSATSAVYVALPVVAVQAFLPAQLPTYAMADRLFRFAGIAFLPIQQFFQGWVPAGSAGDARRLWNAAIAAGAIGLAGGILVGLLSPVASTLLSAGHILVPLDLSIPLGVAFVGVAISSVVGYACLVAVGRVRALAVSTVIGVVVAAPLIVAFAVVGSLPLVAWSVAISELLVAAYQVFTLRSALRQP